MIPPELEAKMYNRIAEVMAPFVGRNVTEHFLGKVKKALVEALEPFAAMDEVPPFEILIIQNPEDPQNIIVRLVRVEDEKTI